MKNKDKYDLTKLNVKVGYLTDGCGHKIDPPRYVTVIYDGRKLFAESTNDPLITFILRWLENDGE